MGGIFCRDCGKKMGEEENFDARHCACRKDNTVVNMLIEEVIKSNKKILDDIEYMKSMMNTPTEPILTKKQSIEIVKKCREDTNCNSLIKCQLCYFLVNHFKIKEGELNAKKK